MCRGLTTLHTVPYNGIEKGDSKRKRLEIWTANNQNHGLLQVVFYNYFSSYKSSILCSKIARSV